MDAEELEAVLSNDRFGGFVQEEFGLDLLRGDKFRTGNDLRAAWRDWQIAGGASPSRVEMSQSQFKALRALIGRTYRDDEPKGTPARKRIVPVAPDKEFRFKRDEWRLYTNGKPQRQRSRAEPRFRFTTQTRGPKSLRGKWKIYYDPDTGRILTRKKTKQ